MKSNLYLSLLFFLIISFGCEGEEAKPVLKSTDLVSDIKVIDLGNEGNASDIVVLFEIATPAQAKQIQIILNKGSDLNGIDRTTVDNLSANSMMSVTVSGNEYDISLPANMTDVEGNPIEANTEYSLGFIAINDDEKSLNSEQGSATLKTEHYLNGDYQGFWRDQLYSDFAVSAKIRLGLAGGRAGGDFFYRANFVSCCEGTDDGSISFMVEADGTLSNFSYIQEVVNFNGGPCDGTYSGSGVIKDYTTLVFDFTGEDCEGSHGNGVLTLKKE